MSPLLSDPMWHVSSRSGVAITLRTAIRLLYLLTYVVMRSVDRDTKPVREYFDAHNKTLVYSSLSAVPFNSLLLSTQSAAVKARRLPLDLGVLSQLAAVHAKQGGATRTFKKVKVAHTRLPSVGSRS